MSSEFCDPDQESLLKWIYEDCKPEGRTGAKRSLQKLKRLLKGCKQLKKKFIKHGPCRPQLTCKKVSWKGSLQLFCNFLIDFSQMMLFLSFLFKYNTYNKKRMMWINPIILKNIELNYKKLL